MRLSWTVKLTIKTGPETEIEVVSWDVTHNLDKVIQLYPPLRENSIKPLNETDLSAAAELISGLRHDLESDRTKYSALSPPDRWGLYDGLLLWIHEFLEACHKHPYCTLSVE